jgi:hypothetical protein
MECFSIHVGRVNFSALFNLQYVCLALLLFTQVFYLLFVGGTGVEIGAFHLLVQVLYHLSQTSSPFCFSYFWDWVSCLCSVMLAGLDHHPPVCATHIVGMTDMYHQTQLLVEMGWPQTMILSLPSEWLGFQVRATVPRCLILFDAVVNGIQFCSLQLLRGKIDVYI